MESVGYPAYVDACTGSQVSSEDWGGWNWKRGAVTVGVVLVEGSPAGEWMSLHGLGVAGQIKTRQVH